MSTYNHLKNPPDKLLAESPAAGRSAACIMARFLAVFVIAIPLIFVSSCKPRSKTLAVYNWSDYIPEEVLEEFRTRTGIELIYDTYSSNEEMYAKIKAGGGGYDIVFPSVDYTTILIKEGMALNLDKSKLANIQNLDPEILAKMNYDPEQEYSVPYAVGAVGIAVNRKYVKNYPRSYDIFNNAALKGKMTMLDDMREVLTSALTVAGLPQNSSDPESLAKARVIVDGWKKNLLRYDSDGFGKGLASGEYWVVQGYLENITSAFGGDLPEDIDFFIPEKGGTMYIDNMVILEGGKNSEAAHLFINYLMEPEVYARIADYFNIPSVNVQSRALRETKEYYTVDDLKKTILLEDIGEAIEPQNKLWEEIRIAE